MRKLQANKIANALKGLKNMRVLSVEMDNIGDTFEEYKSITFEVDRIRFTVNKTGAVRCHSYDYERSNTVTKMVLKKLNSIKSNMEIGW